MNTAVLLIASVLGMDAGNASPVRIAYFVPSDRQPIEGYVGRLDRAMTEVRRFYRDGMEAAGYGPKCFRLDRDEKGRLRVDLVLQHQGRNAKQNNVTVEQAPVKP